jgi:hypothetical protein
MRAFGHFPVALDLLLPTHIASLVEQELVVFPVRLSNGMIPPQPLTLAIRRRLASLLSSFAPIVGSFS